MPPTYRKLVIVGDGACGKTSLLLKYCTNKFTNAYVPTVFENYMADVMVDGKLVGFSLWDTAGEEDYDRLRPITYANADVVLISFALETPASLQNVEEKWAPEIRYYLPGVPVILVGNKSDLRRPSEEVDSPRWRRGAVEYNRINERATIAGTGVNQQVHEISRYSKSTGARLNPFNNEITRDAAEAMAAKIRAIGYFECSAKTAEGVFEVFDFALRSVLTKKSMHQGNSFSGLYDELATD